MMPNKYIFRAIIYFNLFIISFEIIEEKNVNEKNLVLNEKEVKYLNPKQEDNYNIVFKNKVMINLIVLNGYAFFSYDKNSLN